MNRSVSFLVVLALALAACDPVALAPPAVKKSGATKRAKAIATPAPTAAPEATPTPAPTATPTPAPTATPVVPTTLLSGLIKLDAHYIIATGGGNIIATGGGNIIATGGGNIIATGGGNIIATGGGNIIATGGGNYRLLEAEALPIGALLPVQGMVVVPLSLVTGKPLAPAVKTDERGAFTVAIPDTAWADAGRKENVRLFAAIPGESEEDAVLADARLRYDLLVAPDEAVDNALDEDTALVSRFVRESFRDKFEFFLTEESVASGADDRLSNALPEAVGSIVDSVQEELTSEVRRAQVPADRLSALAQTLSDTTLAEMDLADIKIDKALLPTTTAEPGPVMPKLVVLMRKVREAATAKMAGQADYFEQQGYFQEANASQAARGLEPYVVKRPSDVCAFLTKEYLGGDTAMFNRIDPLWGDLEMTPADKIELLACGNSVGIAMAYTVVFKVGTKDRLKQVIRAFGAGE